MDPKALRVLILKRILALHQNFHALPRSRKEEIVSAVVLDLQKEWNDGTLDLASVSPLQAIGLTDLDTQLQQIYSLDEMGALISDWRSSVIPMSSAYRDRIKDPLLLLTDELLFDPLLDVLLAPDNCSLSERDWLPAQMLRIELGKSICYPELPYRKYVKELAKLEHKELRSFCRLSLRSSDTPDHSLLSRFRSSLTLAMRINLLVFFLWHFLQRKPLGDSFIHVVDSTDVAVANNPRPILTIPLDEGTGKKIENEPKIRIYADLNMDCGKRRNKRDKSEMFVGYRVHALEVVDVETKMAYPLVTLAVAANHHDSQLLEPLVLLAKAMGLDIRIIAADEAYGDAKTLEKLRVEEEILVVTPEKHDVRVPEAVEADTGKVYFNEECPTPMEYVGYDTEHKSHEFRCACPCGCERAGLCSKRRQLPIDAGKMGPIPSLLPQRQQLLDLRKVGERPFNLLKHMDGVEPMRPRREAGVQTQVVLSHIIGLLKVMAGLRAVGEETEAEAQQQDLPLESAKPEASTTKPKSPSKKILVFKVAREQLKLEFSKAS